MTDARAFWTLGDGRGEIRTETLPPVAGEHVLVEAHYSGVSRGTETLIYLGEVPESQFERMRCPFQDGAFPGPVKYGYSVAGIIQGGDRTGQRVFALHPHQDRFTLPSAAAVAVPNEVPLRRAVLAANMETALNGLWDADVRTGETLLVVGLGVVGLLICHLAIKEFGCNVAAFDPSPDRLDIAECFGAKKLISDNDTSFQTILHTSGNPDGLRFALSNAETEATILEMSWYGSKQVTLPLGEAFHAKRLTLRSSQVGAVAPKLRALGVDHRTRLSMALGFLADPILDRLLERDCEFASLPTRMEELAIKGQPALCQPVRYPAAEERE